jgi:hypothetical protein
MLDTQPNSRSDRPVYSSPGCDVAGTDIVSVGRKAASGADELRLRTAVRLVDVAALGARSARVARIHGDNSHAQEGGFVCEERAQLGERPRVQRRALSLANRYPVTDAAEIFNCDTASGVFGFANDRLADDVIHVCVEMPLLPSKLTEMSLGALGAGGLKATAEFGDTRTNGECRFAGVGLAVRIDREIANTEVYAEPTFRVDGRAVRNVYGHEEKEFAFSVDEIGLSTDALKSSAMIRTNRAWNDDTTVECKQAYAVETVLERVDSLVVSDGAERLERAEFRLVAPVGLADLRDGANGMLRGEGKTFTKLTVVGLLQGDLVGTLRSESSLSEPRASLVHASHRCQQAVALLGRDQQLYGRYELHEHRHSESITKRKETALPPRPPEGRGFRAGER